MKNHDTYKQNKILGNRNGNKINNNIIYRWKWFSRSSANRSVWWTGASLRIGQPRWLPAPALPRRPTFWDASSWPGVQRLKHHRWKYIRITCWAWDYVHLHSCMGPFHWQPMRKNLQAVGRSSHSLCSWRSSDLLAYSLPQNWKQNKN